MDLLLSEYMITYEPAKVVNGQAVTDFLAAHPVTDSEIVADEFLDEQIMMIESPNSWQMYFDSTSRMIAQRKGHQFYPTCDNIRYGISKKIITDNGTPFKNRGMEKLCQKFSIHHSFSTPYYPPANGLVEAFNKMIVKILKKTVTGNKHDWDEKLQEALWAYRTPHRTTTKATPYSLVYGIESVNPIETQIASLKVAMHQSITDDENVKIRLTKLYLFTEK
ncbi:uncharacterized protein LOC131254248 [Magnolia sinica]|uniref:uncharacterized protein LOC131254248 n=1 Tax=Magnolia sinica TaxID=86752 RepID=UPI00265978EE|nr:uncharacterized protein LOC131254248 [Magnolia sinica]